MPCPTAGEAHNKYRVCGWVRDDPEVSHPTNRRKKPQSGNRLKPARPRHKMGPTGDPKAGPKGSDMPQPEDQSCENCRFWFEIEDEDPDEQDEDGPPDDTVGLCQRYPPMEIKHPAEWPELNSADWCGEWKETVNVEKAMTAKAADEMAKYLGRPLGT